MSTRTMFFRHLVRLVMFLLLCCITRGKAIAEDQAASPDETQTSEALIQDSIREGEIPSPGQIVVAYFTPKDRPPAKDHTSRVRRIVETTASFYESELKRHGFDNRTMNVLRDDDATVQIIDVVGKLGDSQYRKPDGRKIRDEVVPMLTARGIDPTKSVLLMFCNLMDYDQAAGTISHHSPYYGGGSCLSGNAWQCDSEILDPRRLVDMTAIEDAQYGRITIGKHNSIFIGGVIHELGHALSLPHCRERADEAVRGTALMGSGNQTFGEERRGEGRGSFLTQAHAFRLAAHPVFRSTVPSNVETKPRMDWIGLRVTSTTNKQIQILGQIDSDIPIHGVVAYFDPDGHGDYDATTATAVPDQAKYFGLQSGELSSSKNGQVRLVACHITGATSTEQFIYRFDDDQKMDLSSARLKFELSPMIDALRVGNIAKAKLFLKKASAPDSSLTSIGQRVLSRFEKRQGEPLVASVDLDELTEDNREIALSNVKPVNASVGWHSPSYNRLPAKEKLLSVGGDYFATGIYAHAPAEHQYSLSGQWKRLTGQCGLQSAHGGKVDFRIVGDGEILWTQPSVRDGQPMAYDVNVQGVNQLRLVVTDGGDGTGGDWGVWVAPTLIR